MKGHSLGMGKRKGEELNRMVDEVPRLRIDQRYRLVEARRKT